jgi:hypothetical protein
MGKPKGSQKTGGRKKGSTNRIALSVKEAVWNAFLELQEDESTNIVTWGKRNLKDFYIIAAKLIPAELTGRDGKDLIPEISFGSTPTDELLKRADAIKTITNAPDGKG